MCLRYLYDRHYNLLQKNEPILCDTRFDTIAIIVQEGRSIKKFEINDVKLNDDRINLDESIYILYKNIYRFRQISKIKSIQIHLTESKIVHIIMKNLDDVCRFVDKMMNQCSECCITLEKC